METAQAAPKQRPAWLYVLLGCGGLAALICIGTMIVFGLIAKAGKDVVDGVNDPEARQKNALKQLGALPDGYVVVASMSMFGAVQTTVLTDSEQLPDGGYNLGTGHVFKYFRVMANDGNKASKDFLQGKEADARALQNSGINIDTKDIVKRGQLTIEGRKYSYVSARSRIPTGKGNETEASLDTSILFECPGEQLQVGVWSQLDPSPEKTAEELDLAGTVADEAQLVKFLKPMNPCGK
jgi:hypothetical protein